MTSNEITLLIQKFKKEKGNLLVSSRLCKSGNWCKEPLVKEKFSKEISCDKCNFSKVLTDLLTVHLYIHVHSHTPALPHNTSHYMKTLTSCACCRRSGRGRVSPLTCTASARRLWARPVEEWVWTRRCDGSPLGASVGLWSTQTSKEQFAKVHVLKQ